MVRSTKREAVSTILAEGEQQAGDGAQKKRGFSAKGYLVPTKATLFGLDVRFRHIDEKIAQDNEKRNASRITLQGKPRSRGDEAVNRHKIPKNLNMDKMSLQKTSNRYGVGLSVQKKKIRNIVGTSMNSTKYNTISNGTPSVNLPILRSHKDVNVLDSQEFK